MRKKIAILSVMVLTISLMMPNSFAQNAPEAKSDQVKTIFSFKNDIGLTDDQELKLKAMLYDEQSIVDANNNTLRTMDAELAKMIEQNADMSAIKSKLEEMSKIQIDTSCRNIEDSRKVEMILSPDQLTKWKDIQKKFTSPT